MTDFPISPVTARAKLLEELERATYVTLHGVNWTLGLGTADQQALIDALRTSGHAQTPDLWAAIRQRDANINGTFSALNAIEAQLHEMRSLKGWRLNLIRENLDKAKAALRTPTGPDTSTSHEGGK